MRRLYIVLGVLVTTVATACLGNVSAPPAPPNVPYAVIYGRIGTAANTFNIAVYINAYKDSAGAARDSNSELAGGTSASASDSGMYITAVVAKAPATYYLNILATGQGHHGFESSVDTIRALRVRFDSIGGGPHDSIEVDDSLP